MVGFLNPLTAWNARMLLASHVREAPCGWLYNLAHNQVSSKLCKMVSLSFDIQHYREVSGWSHCCSSINNFFGSVLFYLQPECL